MAENTNWVVKNTGTRPLVNYNFMLRVEGLFDLPCKSIRSFSKENKYENIMEGGLNDYVHMRRKPIDMPFTFQVERYCGIDYFDPMPNGAELALPVILMISRSQDNFEKAKRVFVFTGCTVTRKEFGALDAERSGLLLETTTIAYREMACVENLIFNEQDQDRWEFDNLNIKGNGVRHARYNEQELRKPDMEKEARRWKFSGLAIEGNGIRSAGYNEQELRKADMEKQARRFWPAAGNS